MYCRVFFFFNHRIWFPWMSPGRMPGLWSCKADQTPHRNAFWHCDDWFQGVRWYPTHPRGCYGNTALSQSYFSFWNPWVTLCQKKSQAAQTFVLKNNSCIQQNHDHEEVLTFILTDWKYHFIQRWSLCKLSVITNTGCGQNNGSTRAQAVLQLSL